MVLTLLFALATATQADTDMLAQFRAGKWLCSNPDRPSKTCSTIDRAQIQADGTLIVAGEVLMTPDRPVTLETTTIAHMEASAVCSVLEMADLQKSIVRAEGKALPSDRNAMVLEKIATLFKPLIGQKGCEALSLANGQLVKVQQLERLDVPLPPKPVQWVEPEEGYRVAPRPAQP